MTARTETLALMQQLGAHGLSVSFDDANTFRRAQLTLHRWAEMECGDGNELASWSIERDETTGLPYLCTYPHKGEARKVRIADREAGALRRVAAICQRVSGFYYHQTDPRGCALYIGAEPLNESYYNRGVACCA